MIICENAVVRKDDFQSSLVWLIVGALFCFGALKLGLGQFQDPGSGFFPFIMSVLVMIFSSITLVSSIKKAQESKEERRLWPGQDGLKRILFTLLSLFLFVYFLEWLGFFLCTFFLIFILLRFVEPHKLPIALGGAGLIAVISYTLFEIWLKVQLPVGFFGF